MDLGWVKKLLVLNFLIVFFFSFSNYQIEENSNAEFGTKIELFLREGEAEKFLSPEKVSDVINKYSIFVTVPIYVNGELVNTTKAIWTLNPNETTPEMHETFFKQLTKIHHPNIINDRPQYIIQYKVIYKQCSDFIRHFFFLLLLDRCTN